MKPEYGMELYTFDKNNIDKVIIVNPRRQRPKQVLSIYRELMQGKFFDACLVINRVNGNIRVIDGQHRISAMKKYFQENSKTKIGTFMAVYNNLTRDEERQVYTRWNSATRQNTHDFINSHKEVITMYKRFIKELPCTIYGSKNKMRLKNIADGYFSAKEKVFPGGVTYTNYDFVQELQKLTDADMDTLIDTFNIYYSSFNPYDHTDFVNLEAFKTTPFVALFTIIHQNKSRLGRDYIIKKMQNLSPAIISTHNVSGRKYCINAYISFKAVLNNGTTNPARKFN